MGDAVSSRLVGWQVPPQIRTLFTKLVAINTSCPLDRRDVSDKRQKRDQIPGSVHRFLKSLELTPTLRAGALGLEGGAPAVCALSAKSASA